MRGTLGRGLLIMAFQAWLLGARSPTPQVADDLRACLVQTVVERDGQTFTAGGLCDDPTDCIPPGGDRKIAEIVLAALQADQADHRNEYSVRIHLAQGAIFEGKEGLVDGRFQAAAAQRVLWARFLDDPRWTARVRGLGIAITP